ncbi:hypothetical protein ACHAXA_010997 [Cyclostephanos tholiformis]|uniref:Uncharacterized protein n=1 Tax=Cyclostephanos tholiformis TaxID=382380 RepID=A0ABD3RT53_9STRA
MWKYCKIRRNGVLPSDPLKTGTNLSKAPYVIATLIGEFKGKLGTKHHLIALANITSSGINLHWWIEQLMKVQADEGFRTGPTFDNKDRLLASMSEYNDVLHFF